MTMIGRPRRRSLAILLSLGLPGLGELYAGRPRSGILTLAFIYLVSILIFAVLFAPLRGLALVLLPLGLLLFGWVVVITRAVMVARNAPDPYPLQSYNRWYWYVTALIIWLFVLQPVQQHWLRSRWIRAFRIPSGSMERTLLVGDFILVSSRPSARIPRHDDVMIVEAFGAKQLITVKRVVGLPGDTMAMTDGTLIRNGVAVAEPYAQSVDPIHANELMTEGPDWQIRHLVNGGRTAARLYHPTPRNWGPLVVPPDSFFVLGDNRDNSYDSRFYGAVAKDHIRGKPIAIYFSLDRSSIRWSRIGRRFP